MVCKAIIEEKLSKYEVKVRIPSLHKGVTSIGATPTIAIPPATISVPAGIFPNLRVGDVVVVSFEDDNVDKPLVLGLFYSDKSYNVGSDVTTDSLNVKSNTKLSKDTEIGEVTSTNIEQLKGVNKNIQTQFDDGTKRVDNIMDYGCGEIGRVLDILLPEIRTLFNTLDTINT